MTTAAFVPSEDHALRRGLNPLTLRIERRGGFPVLPGSFPLVGHMPATAVDELGLLREGERMLGPVFYWNQGFGHWQIVCAMRDAFSLFKHKLADSGYMREGALAQLRAAFAMRGRAPHIQFLDSFAPALAPALQAAGFVETQRLPVMVCALTTARSAPVVPGLSVVTSTRGFATFRMLTSELMNASSLPSEIGG